MNTFVLVLIGFAVPLLLELEWFPDLDSCEAAITQVELDFHEHTLPRHIYRLRCFEEDANGHVINEHDPIAPVAE
jgi:hypothetical protein